MKMKFFAGTCGGFIELSGEEDLVHKLPNRYPQEGYEESCIWVVWSKNRVPIRVKSIENKAAQFQDHFLLSITSDYDTSGPTFPFLNTTL